MQQPSIRAIPQAGRGEGTDRAASSVPELQGDLLLDATSDDASGDAQPGRLSGADAFFRAEAQRLGYLDAGAGGLTAYYRDFGMLSESREKVIARHEIAGINPGSEDQMQRAARTMAAYRRYLDPGRHEQHSADDEWHYECQLCNPVMAYRGKIGA